MSNQDISWRLLLLFCQNDGIKALAMPKKLERSFALALSTDSTSNLCDMYKYWQLICLLMIYVGGESVSTLGAYL